MASCLLLVIIPLVFTLRTLFMMVKIMLAMRAFIPFYMAFMMTLRTVMRILMLTLWTAAFTMIPLYLYLTPSFYRITHENTPLSIDLGYIIYYS